MPLRTAAAPRRGNPSSSSRVALSSHTSQPHRHHAHLLTAPKNCWVIVLLACYCTLLLAVANQHRATATSIRSTPTDPTETVATADGENSQPQAEAGSAPNPEAGGNNAPADAAGADETSTVESAPASEAEADICRMPPIDASKPACLAFLIRWTYNETEGKCISYVYGGCSGTANLFQTESECQARCPSKGDAPLSSDGNAEQARSGAEGVMIADVCSLGFESGRCFAAFRKWGFNQETGRCEWFVWGGCGGNDNRFDKPEDCQAACGGSEPLTDLECNKSKCPWGLWGHYTAKKCVPVYERGDCCPTRFECPQETNAQPGCTYQGTHYAFREQMPAVTEEEPCLAGCRCQETRSGFGEVSCAHVECPDLFGAPGTRGCKKIYDQAKQCCPTQYRCNATLGENEQYLCEYDGRQYLKGERIYLGGGDRRTCLCNEAFAEQGASPGSPACWDIKCPWESVYHDRLQRSCTPVYYDVDGGCPIDWVCPGDKGKKVDTLPETPGGRSLDVDQAPAAPMSTSDAEATNTQGNPPSDGEKTAALTVEAPTDAQSSSSGESAPATGAAQPSPLPQNVKQSPPSPGDICLIPKSEGKCDALIPHWYYNALEGECQRFNYGGCGGNANRFQRKEECENACAGSPAGCNLAAERGRCRGRIPAWHYDKDSGECKTFMYGGCGGNQNNFKAKEACEEACVKKQPANAVAAETQDETVSRPTRSLLSIDDSNNQGQPLQCTLGTEVFRLGTGFLPESNSCYQCRCSTPPLLTCQEMSRKCPPSPGPNYSKKWKVGQCCPEYELDPSR